MGRPWRAGSWQPRSQVPHPPPSLPSEAPTLQTGTRPPCVPHQTTRRPLAAPQEVGVVFARPQGLGLWFPMKELIRGRDGSWEPWGAAVLVGSLEQCARFP